MLASLVTVNIGFGMGGLLFYPLDMMLAALVFSILISGLSGSIGVLVSLRTGSVRQAQQLMSTGMLILFLPFILVKFIPKGWIEMVGNVLENLEPVQVAIWLAVVLIVVEVVLMFIAMRLFQRSKLILD
jgi:ABC-2 type transport system permease protein